MGFRFRKSFNLGLGFKVNLSKSGIGYSWGVPGFRITKTAKGKTRKNYSIPGTGIGYVEETSNKKRNINQTVIEEKHYQPKNDNSPIYDSTMYSNVEDIETGKIKNFQPAEYKGFLFRLNSLFFFKNLTLFLFIGLSLFYFFYESSTTVFFDVAVISLLVYILLKIFGKVKIEYSFMDDLEKSYNEYVDIWKEVKKSNNIWQVYRTAKVIDAKNNYGAKNAIERDKLKISFRLPWYLKCNINAPVLYFKKVILILLPDKVLIINKLRAGAVNQRNVIMKFYNQGFIEDEVNPKDSEIITHQWLHPNQKGGPDHRFSDNKQLPVYRYSYVDINSPEGINEQIMISNTKICDRLNTFYQEYKKSFNL